MPHKLIQAEPFPLPFDAKTTALVMIDMQRDFVEPGGFGEALGNNVSLEPRNAGHPALHPRRFRGWHVLL
jgi:nicotinamidase-related amidase